MCRFLAFDERYGFLRARLVVVLSAISLVLVSCGSRSSQSFDAPSIDRWPSGELLTSEGRALLPQGVKLRPVYSPGINVTMASEGWVPHLYNDAVKYCTIGYGHLIKKAPCNGTEPLEFRNGLTKPRGVEILVEDLASSQYSVMSTVKVPLTDGQFAALTDFVFNVGSGNFRNSTLLKVVNTNQLDRVSTQFRRWVLAGRKPLTGLQTRREREIDLFFDGMPKPRELPIPGEDLSPIDIRNGE